MYKKMLEKKKQIKALFFKEKIEKNDYLFGVMT